MPLIRKLSFDINIRHHWTNDRFSLNTYLHKGYWYHGKRRENKSIELFSCLIKQGDSIIEVGGHIGYFSVLYSSIVGKGGKVYVFEPGLNNLDYIKKNTKEFFNIQLIEKAVGERNSKEVTFYLDDLTGQNNSIVKDFKGLESNLKLGISAGHKVKEVKVEMTTLDSFCNVNNIKPDFIKVDVEGFEYKVLLGSESVLTNKPCLMIEVQSNKAKIYDLLKRNGYSLFDIHRNELELVNIERCRVQNVFCLHHEEHKDLIKSLIQ